MPSQVLPAARSEFPQVIPGTVHQGLLSSLRKAFGVEMSLIDGLSGESIHVAADQPPLDLNRIGRLAREVSRRGQPELLAADDPFAVLGIPLRGEGGALVAVGVFVTRPVAQGDNLFTAAMATGLEPAVAAEWANRQSPWPIEALERTALVTADLVASKTLLVQRERDLDNFAGQLSITYEEISLFYRLIQNLKLSESDEDLGRLALEWMEEVVPAQGLAIQYVPLETRGRSGRPKRTSSQLLTRGDCPLDDRLFNRLIERLDLRKATRPIVINGKVTGRSDWPLPAIRQVIVVPLAEADHLFGWLAAVNHRSGADFGSVEANLLHSVGVILGIHSGNIELYHQQAELLSGIVRALTSAIDAKDRYTCGHSDRVARVAVTLARELGCGPKAQETVYLSGLLHDIGKIGISDAVLGKPGGLTAEEYEHIKTHVLIGHRILIDLSSLDEVLPVVRHHHESWDGAGYPQRLKGEEIPLLARIVAVADSFDAMGSDRPYRRGMADDKIDAIFREGAGKQWDPRVVDAFFRIRDEIREIASYKQDLSISEEQIGSASR